ncbi:MAG: hypothetical protein LBR38_08890 [Synergistaceae bacterium]|jgi:hypothetical protein|nr:hypothetical protein [Synergistaceae bacterium]
MEIFGVGTDVPNGTVVPEGTVVPASSQRSGGTVVPASSPRSGGTVVPELFLCAASACAICATTTTVLSDVASSDAGGVLWILSFAIWLVSCVPPLVLRFCVLQRPVPFWKSLCLFPITLVISDVFTSLSLQAARLVPGGFVYVPAMYLMGWGPLFLLLHVHNSLLTLARRSYRERRTRRDVPFCRRMAACTLALALSSASCVALAAALDVDGQRGVGRDDPFGTRGPWRSIELWDAGTLDIPYSWYIADSNGRLNRTRRGDVVQNVRRALVAHPYGRGRGPDFFFEIIVYWWTLEDGLPLRTDAAKRLQEWRFESLRRGFPDIDSTVSAMTVQYAGREVDSLTVETLAIPGHVVRFKNLVFWVNERLYSVTASYPAEDESKWNGLLGRVIERWHFGA